MKAVILAAGEGTRLRPLTLETPHPLIQVAGKCIIERILESLPSSIDEVVLVVEYLKEKIESHLGDHFQSLKITYVPQGKMRGTYGALCSAKELLNERFLVLNGDDLHSKEELEQFIQSGERTFGLQKMLMPHYYEVLVDKEGYVAGFNKDSKDEKLVATGQGG